jgi:hypothetical protein
MIRFQGVRVPEIGHRTLIPICMHKTVCYSQGTVLVRNESGLSGYSIVIVLLATLHFLEVVL